MDFDFRARNKILCLLNVFKPVVISYNLQKSFWALGSNVNYLSNFEQACFSNHGNNFSFSAISVSLRNAVKTVSSKNIDYTYLILSMFAYTQLYISHKRF